MKLADIAAALQLPCRGDTEREITALTGLTEAGAGHITFLQSPRLLTKLPACRAEAILLRAEHAEQAPVQASLLISEQPYLDYARLSQLFALQPRREGVDARAVVGADVQWGENVHVDATAVIGPGCVLGDEVRIGAGSVLGAGVSIGRGSVIDARVSIYHDCHIGAYCRILSGAVIGADGFGYAERSDGSWEKIAQLGRVCIGDHVEIGANTTIDRGALSDTVIESGVIIDNQVQIAHNVHIGANTAIAGCVGIAGSSHIGQRCRLGGAVGVLGHLQICDDVTVGAKSVVRSSITEPGIYVSGSPLLPMAAWQRMAARLKQLDSLARRLSQQLRRA